MILAAVALSCCMSGVEPNYTVDFRTTPYPVMLNEPAKVPVGRTVPLSYGIGNTPREDTSEIPISSQLRKKMDQIESGVLLRNIVFDNNVVGFAENYHQLTAEAIVISKRGPK
jgi:hypothetical protein